MSVVRRRQRLAESSSPDHGGAGTEARISYSQPSATSKPLRVCARALGTLLFVCVIVRDLLRFDILDAELSVRRPATPTRAARDSIIVVFVQLPKASQPTVALSLIMFGTIATCCCFVCAAKLWRVVANCTRRRTSRLLPLLSCIAIALFVCSSLVLQNKAASENLAVLSDLSMSTDQLIAPRTPDELWTWHRPWLQTLNDSEIYSIWDDDADDAAADDDDEGSELVVGERTNDDVEGTNDSAIHHPTPKRVERVPVVLVHTPKTGGLSMLSSLVAAGVDTCVWGSGFEQSNCSCNGRQVRDSNQSCARNSQAAVIEAPYREAKKMVGTDHSTPSLYLAIVRDPEQWFYSSIGQWCANTGRDDIGCQPTASLHNLSHWFGQHPNCEEDLHR